MKSLRKASAAVAVAAAFGLLLSASGAAEAASGHFRYSYTVHNGHQAVADLTDPASRTCLELPEARAPRPSADTPVNDTGSAVAMFTGAGCTGEYYGLRPGGKATSRLKLRSVSFS